MQNGAHKVQQHHLVRLAILSVRQSTLLQVQLNTASTMHQYDMLYIAKSLGLDEARIVTIDVDQGNSGASAEKHDGFKELMELITAGRVGIIFARETSRLARNALDTHTLLRVCAETDIAIPRETRSMVLFA